MHKEAFATPPMEAENQPPSWPIRGVHRGFRFAYRIPSQRHYCLMLLGALGKIPLLLVCVQGLCTLSVEDKEAQALLCILNNRILMGTESPH